MNEEVKISLTANVKPFRDAMRQAIKDIDLASIHMEDFNTIVENASGAQLKKIASQLKQSVQEQKAIIKSMQQELVIGRVTGEKSSVLSALRLNIQDAKVELKGLEKRLATVGGNTLTPLQKALGKVRGAVNSLHKPIAQFGKLFGRMIYFSVIFKGIMLIQNGLRSATELSSMATNNFTAMGNVIAGVLVPVVEWFANAVRKAVVWVAGLIKYLTGINILAKGIDATNKKISKLGKNAKKSGKDVKDGLLSGLDEITNISQDTSGGASSGSGGDDLTAQLGALGSLNEMMNEMSSLKFEWAKPLKLILEFMIENWDWLKYVLLGVVGVLGAFAVAMGITNIVMYACPLTWIITGIIALIAIIATCIAFWDEIKVAISNFAKKAEEVIYKAIVAILTFFTDLIRNVINTFSQVPVFFALKVLMIITEFNRMKDQIIAFFVATKDKITNLFSGIGAWFGARVNDIVSFFKQLPTKIWTIIVNLYNKITSLFIDVGSVVGSTIANAVKGAINSVLKTAVGLINGFLKAINGAIDIINAIPGVNIKKLKMLDVPSFDVGTNYVPQDMIAQIHKGERIVPAKYNNDDWVGEETDMSETNALLEQLISVVASKNLTIGRDEIGKASVDYIKAERRRRGELII